MSMSELTELLAPKEAAKILGVSTETLRRYQIDGAIEAEATPGGHRRIKRAEVML